MDRNHKNENQKIMGLKSGCAKNVRCCAKYITTLN